MVGLSVILEGGKSGSKTQPPVLSKAALTINPGKPSVCVRNASNPSSLCWDIFPPPFLDRCFLCKQQLLPGNDIYMYKGDKGFCSVECRCRQIFMDEESLQTLAAVKHSSPSSTSRSCKTSKN